MINFKHLLTIAVVTSLGVFGGNLIAPIEVRYIESITNNPALTGTVFGVGSIFFAIFSFYVGRWSDRVGRKKVILWGLVASILYAGFYSLVFNLFQLYGVKFAWALAAVSTGPILAAYLQDFLNDSERKGRYFGYVYSAQSIAGSAGAVLGGYLAQTYSLVVPFYFLVGTYVVMFVLVWAVFPSKQIGLKAETESKPQQSVWQTIKFVFSKPELLFYLSMIVRSYFIYLFRFSNFWIKASHVQVV